MDLTQVRGRFDDLVFDAWNFGSSSWVLKQFSGKLALADPKISLMSKGTRRRMLYTSPGSEPTSTVIRCGTTNEIYMVGTQNKDSLLNTYYRNVVSLHYGIPGAVVTRKVPTGPSNNPGWAVLTNTLNTFADYELRSDNENVEMQISQWGSFDLTFPAGSDVQRHDNLTVDGRTFYIFETAPQSGFVGAKATDRPDARVNIVYTTLGASVYDPATLTNNQVATNYNVTAFIEPYDEQQDLNSTIVKDRIRLMILKSWIGVTPRLLDKITYGGKTYIVNRVASNQLGDEWHIIGEV